MGLSSAEELGKILAKGISDTKQLKEDVFPSDVAAAMLLAPFDRLKVTVEVTGTKFTYDPTSFILDHPVYGELDSSTLKLDGGYLQGNVFPLAFPISFANEAEEVLFTYTS